MRVDFSLRLVSWMAAIWMFFSASSLWCYLVFVREHCNSVEEP